ncbi:MAG: hypothetical protein QF662_09410 [Phycisphaerae bacterium]|nr:hypothetical protein [Phycisphaerae bacterium]
MKMVLISYNAAVDTEVMEALARAGAENYTKWPHVLGKGTASGTHSNTEVWPGTNNTVMVVVDGNVAQRLMDEVRGLRGQLGHEGVKAFLLNVEDVT